MRVLKKLLPPVLAAAVVAGLVWGGIWFFRENCFQVNQRILWRHARTVDLHGHDLNELDFLHEFTRLETIDARGCELSEERYLWLRETFPACTVQWDVPFQGVRCSTQTQKLALTTLSWEDVEKLDYFPELKSVDGWDCPDYPQLAQLQKRHPECKVFYNVPIADINYDCDVTELSLADVDVGELEEKLQYLPNVSTLHLKGKLPQMDQVQAMLKKYPKIALSWQIDLEDAVLDIGATTLNLAGFPVEDVDYIVNLIPYLPALENVDLTDCGLPETEMLSLVKKYPQIQFLFDVAVGPVVVRSDVQKIDLSGHIIEDLEAVEQKLGLFPNLERVEMCECGIPSQQMDEMSQRNPDIRFVWTVNLGGLKVRTDATYFIPTKYDVEVSDRDLEELRYCVDMIGVDVGHMKNVTHCKWAAYMPNLKYLILADSHVSDLTPLTGLENLVFLELFLSWVRDLTPLQTCTALEDLNLCYTYGNPEPLTKVTSLKRLWWSGNWTARARYGDILREALPDCEINFHSSSSTGEGWRTGKHYYDMRDLFGMYYMHW